MIYSIAEMAATAGAFVVLYARAANPPVCTTLLPPQLVRRFFVVRMLVEKSL